LAIPALAGLLIIVPFK